MTRSKRTRTGSARNAGRDTRLTSAILPPSTSNDWISLEEKERLQVFHWPLMNDPVVQAFIHITARIIADADVPPPNPRLYQEYINYLDNTISVALEIRGAPADVVLVDEETTMERIEQLEKELAVEKQCNIDMQRDFDSMNVGVVAEFNVTEELCIQLRVRDEGKPEEKWTVELMSPEWAEATQFKHEYANKEEARRSFQQEVRKHL